VPQTFVSDKNGCSFEVTIFESQKEDIHLAKCRSCGDERQFAVRFLWSEMSTQKVNILIAEFFKVLDEHSKVHLN
jgi:hypothetical protein